MNKLDAELWRSDLYLIAVGNDPISHRWKSIKDRPFSTLEKSRIREPRISFRVIMEIAFSNFGFVTFQFDHIMPRYNISRKSAEGANYTSSKCNLGSNE
jgi:hypothetical protein